MSSYLKSHIEDSTYNAIRMQAYGKHDESKSRYQLKDDQVTSSKDMTIMSIGNLNVTGLKQKEATNQKAKEADERVET